MMMKSVAESSTVLELIPQLTGVCVRSNQLACSSRDDCVNAAVSQCEARNASTNCANFVVPQTLSCESGFCRQFVLAPCVPSCETSTDCTKGNECSAFGNLGCCESYESNGRSFGEECNSNDDCASPLACSTIFKICYSPAFLNSLDPRVHKECDSDRDCTTPTQYCAALGSIKRCLGNRLSCEQCKSDGDCAADNARIAENISVWCSSEGCCRAGITESDFVAGARNKCDPACSAGTCGVDQFCESSSFGFQCCLPKAKPFTSGIELGESCENDESCRSGFCMPYAKVCAIENVENEPLPPRECFPADALVELEHSNNKVRMSALQIGDRIRVAHRGPRQFSAVYFFSHRDDDSVSTFVELATLDSHRIVLTPGHLLPIFNSSNSASNLRAAAHVRPGDVVATSRGASVVSRVSLVKKRGLFNPHTHTGEIVVDGVLASVYTTAVPQWLAHALLAPLRLLSRTSHGVQLLLRAPDMFLFLLDHSPS